MLINLCYCLTRLGVSGIHLWDLFQNISCYCLTKYKKKLKGVKLISKHLMLLFNWEQVADRLNIKVISKHLMLLFNITSIVKKIVFDRFQNISCYCLTNDFTSFFNGLFKKTTILCTFPLFFPSAPSIYCFSKKVHISAISNTFSGNHLVKFCTFKYQ